MKFSFWPNPVQDFETVAGLYAHAEATGWDGIWYADHFMPNAEDCLPSPVACRASVSARSSWATRTGIPQYLRRWP